MLLMNREMNFDDGEGGVFDTSMMALEHRNRIKES